MTAPYRNMKEFKIIDLFEFPVENVFSPKNQHLIKEIEQKASSNFEAIEMLMDAGITTPSDYYKLDDWFWTQSKAKIHQILNRRKATII